MAIIALQSGLLPPKNPLPDSFSPSEQLKPKFKFQISNSKTAIESSISTPKTSLNSFPNHQNTRILVEECVVLLDEGSNLSDTRQLHARIAKLDALCIYGNKLVIRYCRNSDFVDYGLRLFDEISDREVSCYASMIRSLFQLEKWDYFFQVLDQMLDDGFMPDRYLVPTVLKACAANGMVRSGKMVHGYAMRKKLVHGDIYVGNALIDFYSNCGDLRSSRCVFELMRERDVVSWTALVSAYMNGGMLDEALDVFHLMRMSGVKPDLISWSAVVSGFARNGDTDMALMSLGEMQEEGLNPKVNSWNGIISGCVQNGYFEDALMVFARMLKFPEHPNVVTIVSVLRACAGLKDINLGKTIHVYALKFDLGGHTYVEGSLIDMYSKCGRVDCAQRIFNEVVNKNRSMWNERVAAYINEGKMEKAVGILDHMVIDGVRPDIVTYNTLLAGHARNGQKAEALKMLSEMIQMNLMPNIVSFNVLISGFQQFGLSIEALKLFQSMQSPSGIEFPSEVSIRPNSISITGALAACADLNLLRQGKEIHGYILRNDFLPNVYISTALIDLYAKCNDIGSASKLFQRVKERNTVMWNVLMAGKINNMYPDEAFYLFSEMLREGLAPSSVSLMILLPVCSEMAALRVGRELHAYILKGQFDESNLASALIDMYAKCGSITEARSVFDYNSEKDVVLWNTMISAYSVHGLGKNAIALFQEMEASGVVPDHITFVSVLSACIRDGLVEEGRRCFSEMEQSYGINAGLEHYTCMVGILGAAGMLEEAFALVKKIPCSPDACLWATLLRACRMHSNPEIGERAAKALFELEPSNASNYILLSNIYVSSGLWDYAKNVRILMRARKLMAINECTFLNIGRKIHAFKGGRSSHLQLAEILAKWETLASEMERDGYSPLDPIFEDDQELDPCSCLHTEKLAICLGLISSDHRLPIRLSKNIRMCIDCHTSAKYISKTDAREIFVKDAAFYHHFKDGKCSCQDRW